MAHLYLCIPSKQKSKSILRSCFLFVYQPRIQSQLDNPTSEEANYDLLKFYCVFHCYQQISCHLYDDLVRDIQLLIDGKLKLREVDQPNHNQKVVTFQEFTQLVKSKKKNLNSCLLWQRIWFLNNISDPMWTFNFSEIVVGTASVAFILFLNLQLPFGGNLGFGASKAILFSLPLLSKSPVNFLFTFQVWGESAVC